MFREQLEQVCQVLQEVMSAGFEYLYGKAIWAGSLASLNFSYSPCGLFHTVWSVELWDDMSLLHRFYYVISHV